MQAAAPPDSVQTRRAGARPGPGRRWWRWALLGPGLALALALALSPAAGGGRGTGPGGPAEAAPAGAGEYVHVGTWPVPDGPLEPLDMAFGPSGELYVADGFRRAVLAYHGNGQAWAEWPSLLAPGRQVPICLAYDSTRARLITLWRLYETPPEGGEPRPGPLYMDVRAPDGGTDNVVHGMQFLPGALDAASDPTTGDLLVLAESRVFRLRMPVPGLAGSFPVGRGGPAPSRLAVLADGRVAVAGPGVAGIQLYAADGNPLTALALPEGEAVALAASPGGGLRALVRPLVAGGAAPPLVLAFGAGGGRVESRSADELRAPPVPVGAWPWALAESAEGLAFSTGQSRFEVHAFTPGWAPAWRLSGRWLRERYLPLDNASLADAGLSLAASPDGNVEALDPLAGRVLRFDANGVAETVAAAPYAALDLALDGQGRRFVSTSDGWLLRLSEGDGISPTWRVGCACDLGGRLAAARDRVYVSRPRGLAVGLVDAALGGAGGGLQLLDAVGLWPGDLAVAADERLYTADLVRAEVQAWAGESPAGAWPAGLLAGPRRLAAGHLADGAAALAALMADGSVELHTLDGNMVGHWWPRLATGGSFTPVDLAMDAEGLIWLADARARALHLFAPGGGVPATPVATAPPAPTTDLTCEVRGNKQAGPGALVLGQTVAVTLTLAARCPDRSTRVGADVMLVIDRSTSMSSGGLRAAQSAARSFVELLDLRYHQVGLASFNEEASVDVPLTTNVAAVIDGLAALRAEGQTNLAGAIDRAQANLRDFGRAEALPVIVLLTDGRLDAGALDPRPAATGARNAGTQIYTIGLGSNVDQALLRDMAGRADRFFFAPAAADLFPIYGQILRLVLSSLAGNLVIDDALGDGMTYQDGSARPPALVAFGRLSWGRSLLPADGITLTYRLRPTHPGCQPTNRLAVANYTDADGAARAYVFPVPTVCVTAPTPTPTRLPSATPRPSPTPIHARLSLPITYRDACVPGVAHADTVLLVDTSDSMAGEKLAKAKLAAIDFLSLLGLPRDQAAVLGFNSGIQQASLLSGSRAGLEAAIQRLASGRGTDIAGALRAAISELRSPRHRPENRPVIVLMSDGRHNGDPREVLTAAEEARMGRIAVFTIGLGQDADAGLLRAIADTGRYYVAPDANALTAIYRQIAGAIPCR